MERKMGTILSHSSRIMRSEYYNALHGYLRINYFEEPPPYITSLTQKFVDEEYWSLYYCERYISLVELF